MPGGNIHRATYFKVSTFNHIIMVVGNSTGMGDPRTYYSNNDTGSNTVQKEIGMRNKYEIKAIKTFVNIEGEGYNANLYRNGKFVCRVIEPADGGPMSYEFKTTDEHDILKAHIKELEKKEKDPGPYEFEMDVWIDNLVNEKHEATVVKRKHNKMVKDVKTQTFYRRHSDEGTDVLYRTIKAPYCPDVKAYLTKQYGDDLKEIVNETVADVTFVLAVFPGDKGTPCK